MRLATVSGTTRIEDVMSNRHMIFINLKGANARPEKIGMGELGDLLKHLEAALRSAVPIGEKIAHSEETDPLISLISLREGDSVDMGAAVLDYGIPALSEISAAIDKNLYDEINVNAHQEFYKISSWVRRRRLALEIEPDDSLGIKRVLISKERPILSPSASDFTVDGQTTAWGFLTRAGGVKPRSALVFPDKSKVIISADEVVTKELGERLYEDVGIEGVATWRVKDWKMTSFKAVKVLDYRPYKTDVVQTFKELNTASEGRWNGGAVDSYIEDIRSEKQ